MTPHRLDDRGVTVPMNYSLMVTIVALLAAVLVAGMGAYVGDQQATTARDGLSVVGHRIAADLSTADRLAATVGPGGSVELDTDLPETVAGSSYVVEIVSVPSGPPNTYDLVLATTDPEVTVTVPVRTRGAVTPTSFAGGPVSVRATPSGLEVGRA